MTFNPSIPQATDKVRISQSDLLTNNTELDDIFGKNHIKYSDTTADKGKHAGIVLANLTVNSKTPPATTSKEWALYVDDDANTNPQIYYKEPSSGTEYQITGPIKNTGSYYETALPGGIGLKFGTLTLDAGISSTFTYTTTFGLTAFSSSTDSVSLTNTSDTTSSPRVIARTNTSFTAKSNSSGTYLWQALGR